MLLVRTSIKQSAIHGLGCYAEEEIKAGQLVWQLDPRFDLELELDDLEHLPASTRKFLETHCYAAKKNGKKISILCADHARHMNHSSAPNLLEAGENKEQNIAARDISIGEELTCDYHQFDLDAASRLSR